MVNVHELGASEYPKSYVFKGTKDYEPGLIASYLGITTPIVHNPQNPQLQANKNRFLAPIGEVGATLETLVNDLGKDPWPQAPGNRPTRCTGVALSIAQSIMEKSIGKRGGRIFVFAGGPATLGPGAVVPLPLTETMRSHRDIAKDEGMSRFL